jgi:hypothetical protein
LNEIIPSIAAAIGISTKLTDTAKKLRNADLNNLLADLSLQLSEARVKISELLQENVDLREQLDSREDPVLCGKSADAEGEGFRVLGRAEERCPRPTCGTLIGLCSGS